MQLAYQRPGVYYERADTQAPAIGAFRTDITGFVGLAPRGPVDTPVPVESWRQFEAHFGGFTATGFLAYAVRGFFENGGRRCWITRVASRDPVGGHQTASTILETTAASEVWRIAASSPGVWGNNLTVRMTETHDVQLVSLPGAFQAEWARVATVSRMTRGTQVRLWQNGAIMADRVISHVDAPNGRIYWVHPDPEARLLYDAPVLGFDTSLPLLIESVEYTLSAFELGRLKLIREGLSLIRENNLYGPRVLGPIVNPADMAARRVLPPAPLPIVIEELRPVDGHIDTLDLSDNSVRLSGGADGLALLTVEDFIGEPVAPADGDETRYVKRRGLEALADLDEISIVAMPDIHIRPLPPPQRVPIVRCIPDPCLDKPQADLFEPQLPFEIPPIFTDAEIYRAQAAMVLQCESLRTRVAILETPFSAAADPLTGPAVAQAWRSQFDSKYAALYYPWARVVDPLRDQAGAVRDVPPSGHIAGQYGRTDFEAGVHKAPANAPLEWVQDVTSQTSDELHGLFNSAGINVLRTLPGRRVRIMGARTVSSDTNWRFVNVRRLLIMIEHAIELSMQWAAFEPNDRLTRSKILLAISSYLIALWQTGALVGATMSEAFFVKCDEENNPPRTRDNGQLICDVGVAPSQPLEFVVLRVGRAGNEFEIQEMGLRSGEI